MGGATLTDKKTVVDQLQQMNDKFRFLSKAEVIDNSHIINIDKKTIFLKPDEYIDGIYILYSGKVKISMLQPNGKSLLLRFSNPPGVLGDIEALHPFKVRTYVETVYESTLLHVPKIVINAYLKEDIDFLHFIIEQLSYKLYSISVASGMNQNNTAKARLASYILSVSDERPYFSDKIEGKSNELETEYLIEIAELIGTSYRHLSRILREWQKDEIIRKEGRHISIINRQMLMELSEGNLYE
jgi:CRP-like cAMP-binding protein